VQFPQSSPEDARQNKLSVLDEASNPRQQQQQQQQHLQHQRPQMNQNKAQATTNARVHH